MKDKEKQIESKALTLGNELYCKQDKFDMSNPYEVAEAVIELGYRKLPKDARVFIPTDEQYIMLSREEHNALLLEQKRLREIVDRIPCGYELKEKTSKETAENIFNILLCTPKEQIENKIKELAVFYMVEIKE